MVQEAPPAALPKAVLQERAGIMFSGVTGAVVASGKGPATTAATYGLAKDVVSVIDGLPPELFDKHAAHRPCGLLCKLGASGMLLGDLLGLPLMPWVLAEPVGKEAARKLKEIPGEVKKTKKALQRKGGDAAACFFVLRSEWARSFSGDHRDI